jgi:hypothetical protein
MKYTEGLLLECEKEGFIESYSARTIGSGALASKSEISCIFAKSAGGLSRALHYLSNLLSLRFLVVVEFGLRVGPVEREILRSA